MSNPKLLEKCKRTNLHWQFPPEILESVLSYRSDLSSYILIISREKKPLVKFLSKSFFSIFCHKAKTAI